MKQETFTDIEYSYRKKKTRREEFLEIEDAIYDSYAMRKFIGTDFMTEAVSDKTTLYNSAIFWKHMA